MKMIATAIAIAVVGLASAPRSADACSCIPPKIDDQAQSSDIIFVGSPSEKAVSSGEMAVSYTFAVSKVLKGEPVTQLAVSTAKDSAMCGAYFEPGKEYVVYVKIHNGENKTGLCSGNELATAELIAKVESAVAATVPPTEPPPPSEPPPAEPPPPAPPVAKGNPACGGCASGSSDGPLGILLLFGMVAFAVRRRR